ncbi:MAG: TRAP transporter permease [Bacillaceae bacterium]|uniref:TRAP transporter permease n=1 Tax=Alkalihalobacterium chitinilyticum TaxID=2980103 RepID=A0ABT5V9S2_9BACI|nr:TRAP transporter permease [Alkalihalobacterium chitinilyticum]MDE5412211.1 TRAP transporter permease [Alkalihalobacterium chitinilyticum]MEB1806508.1 TRAP transporter permease [Bacillaceae bacterium]
MSKDLKETEQTVVNDDKAKELEEAVEGALHHRELTGWIKYTFITIAVVGALFHLYVLNFHPIEPWVFRSIHLALGAVLGFILFKSWKTSKKVNVVDWLLIAATLYVTFYIYTNVSALLFRFGVMPQTQDTIVAVLGLIIVLELTRRTSGWTLPILAGVFILYAFAGPWLPGILNHNGYSFGRFVTYIFGTDGVFGVTLDVSSKYILLFIIFGAFLQMSGVGKYFIDFSFSLAGGMRGGPAKVSVISSGLMGMMNGTSAGNAVATGSLTIPLMRRVGYSGRFAAATEATASAGGQIMIPIMGAGAFIMAEVTGIPYSEIIIAATIPALLYFLSVYFMVDFQALKNGMKGLSRKELPSLRGILKQAYLFIPIVLLIGALLSGFSVIRSGTVAIIACLVVSWIHPSTRMGLKKIIHAFELGMKNTIQLLAVCACAGIIVGVIALTGVGLRFSSMLLGIADNNMFLALLFAMGISILLGMGMPTTAAYAVAASVVAPGLIQIGIEPIFAHMFVFYYAVMSAITPPVALAAYAAAGVAGTDPFKTGVTAFKLGIAAFIVPFMFIYSPQLLMEGSAGSIAVACITAAVGIYLLSAAVQGWFAKKSANIIVRVLLIGASLCLINANWMMDLIALSIIVVAVLIQRMRAPEDPVITQKIS